MMHWVAIIINEHVVWISEIVDDYSIFNIDILHNVFVNLIKPNVLVTFELKTKINKSLY